MLRGAGYPVFDLDFARVGVITCYDGYGVSDGISLLDLLNRKYYLFVHETASVELSRTDCQVLSGASPSIVAAGS